MFKFLVIDLGIGIQHALRLLEDGNEVYYYIPWQRAFPTYIDYLPGIGFGFKKVMDFFSVLDEVDYIVFTDIGYGWTADFLRKNNYFVYGGSPAEVLELDRMKGKEILNSLGIKTTKGIVLKGREELEEFLEENRGKSYYLKLNSFRGDLETSKVTSVDDAQAFLDKLAGIIGPLIEEIPFLLEEEIKDAVEVGVDAWFDGENFCPIVCNAFEIKANNFGRYLRLEEWIPFRDMLTNPKFIDYLRSVNHRGPINFEGFWDGEEIYISDPCIRHSYPLSVQHALVIPDYTEFIISIATGECIVPNISDKIYFGLVNIYSDAMIGTNLWMPLNIPEELRDRVAFRRAVMIDDKPYAAPPDSLILSIINSGRDLKEVADKLKEDYDKCIPGTRGTDVKGDIYPMVEERLKEFEKYGIKI